MTLICEGVCNPSIRRIDHLIAQQGRDMAAFEVAAFVRRAVYTPHLPVTGEVYRCATCGTPRQYGGDPMRTRYQIGAYTRQARA